MELCGLWFMLRPLYTHRQCFMPKLYKMIPAFHFEEKTYTQAKEIEKHFYLETGSVTKRLRLN